MICPWAMHYRYMRFYFLPYVVSLYAYKSRRLRRFGVKEWKLGSNTSVLFEIWARTITNLGRPAKSAQNWEYKDDWTWKLLWIFPICNIYNDKFIRIKYTGTSICIERSIISCFGSYRAYWVCNVCFVPLILELYEMVKCRIPKLRKSLSSKTVVWNSNFEEG